MGVRRLVKTTVRLACAIGLAIASAVAQGRVVASDGRVKLPAAGETQAMAFVTVENPTMYAIYVMSAAADAAGKVELRDAGQDGDARLKPVEFITVPAYGRVDMGPSGVHLLLRDLKQPLKEGDAVALTPTTDIDVTLKLQAVVSKE